MIIIGERINASRKVIGEAVRSHNEGVIQKEAKLQVEAGCDYLDVNCGTSMEKEPDDLKWLVQTIQSVAEVPLCIDSPNPDAIEQALAVCKGKALVNSITAERNRADVILPLIKKFDCLVVGLTMSEKGVPKTSQERVAATREILNFISKHRINRKQLYIDPVVQPVATDVSQGVQFLEALRLIKEMGLKTIAGISNVSFGLPQRSLLNSTFLGMAVAAGLDAAIIDILDKKIEKVARASAALAGKDEFCQRYLKAFRKGRLE